MTGELCHLVANIRTTDEGLELQRLLLDLASIGYRTEVINPEHHIGWDLIVYRKGTPDERP